MCFASLVVLPTDLPFSFCFTCCLHAFPFNQHKHLALLELSHNSYSIHWDAIHDEMCEEIEAVEEVMAQEEGVEGSV